MLEEKLISEMLQRVADRLPFYHSSGQLLAEETQTDALLAASRHHASTVVSTFLPVLQKLRPSAASCPDEASAARLSASAVYLWRLLRDCLSASAPSRFVVVAGSPLPKVQSSVSDDTAAALFDVCTAVFRELHAAGEAAAADQHSEQIAAVGAVVRLVSALKPDAISKCFESAVRELGQGKGNETDILLLEHMEFPRGMNRLITMLNEHATSKKGALNKGFLSLGPPLTKAIWNWIQGYPDQFSACFDPNSAADCGADSLFEAFFALSDNVKRRIVYWPTQQAILLIMPSVYRHVFEHKESSRKEHFTLWKFVKKIDKAFNGKKGKILLDVSVRCYVDVIRASALVSNKKSVLHEVASSVRGQLQSMLINPQRPYTLADGVNDIPVMIDYMVAQFRLEPLKTVKELFLPCIAPNAAPVMKLTLVRVLLQLSTEDWAPPAASQGAKGTLTSMSVRPVDDIVPRKTPPTHPAPAAVVGAKVLSCVLELVRPLKLYFYQEIVNYEKLSKTKAKEKAMSSDILISMVRLFKAAPVLAVTPMDTPVNRDTAPTSKKTVVAPEELVETTTLFTGLCSCIEDFASPDLQQEAVAALRNLHIPAFMALWHPPDVMNGFLHISSTAIIHLAEYLAEHPNLPTTQLEVIMNVLVGIIQRNNEFLKQYKDSAAYTVPGVYGTSCNKLEAAILNALCSSKPEVCSKAATICGLMCRQYDTLSEISNSFSINYDEYSLLESIGQLVTGRAAQQKSIRTQLRKVERQTTGNLEAWHYAYSRWQTLTQTVLDDTTQSQAASSAASLPAASFSSLPAGGSSASELKTIWQNYTHFLNALCGVSKDRRYSLTTVPGAGGASGAMSPTGAGGGLPSGALSVAATAASGQSSRDLSSFRLKSPKPKDTREAAAPKSTHEQLIAEMLRLMVCDNADVRAHVVSALGTNLAASAQGDLFRSLSADVRNFIGESGQLNISENATLYVDQAMSVVKSIIDMATDSSELAFADFETLLLAFVQYVSHLVIDDRTVRMRCKLCTLIELVMSRREFIVFQNEKKFRSSVMQHLMEWTSDFYLMKAEAEGTVSSETVSSPSFVSGSGHYKTGSSTSSSSSNAVLRLFKEKNLDVFCMRAVAGISKGFELRSFDDVTAAIQDSASTSGAGVGGSGAGSTNAGTASQPESADSQAFFKYFTFLTRFHQKCRTDPDLPAQLREYTILALTNLLNANIESSLDYFVTMGYHTDADTRAAFLAVLTNNLKQRAEIDTGAEDGAQTDRYDDLMQLILHEDLVVIQALIEATPITEADQVAKELIAYFEANDCTLNLLAKAINQEVERTLAPGTLFRSNSMASKMMGVYSRMVGPPYLRKILSEQVSKIYFDTSSFEVDPDRITDGTDAQANLARLEAVAQGILDVIVAAHNECPPTLRYIAKYLDKTVNEKFQGHGNIAQGGFLFLRFINPGITTPESYGIVDTTDPPAMSARRALILVTKMLQNLVNGQHFREPYMQKLNSFIDKNKPRLAAFYDQLTAFDESTAVPTRAVQSADVGMVHYLLSQSMDKMRSLSSGPEIDKLAVVLSSLGPPPEPKKKTAAAGDTRGRKQGKGKGDSEYTNSLFEEFMERHAKRSDVEQLSKLDLFYVRGESKEKRTVFYYVARRLKPNMDRDLVLYHILRTMQPHFSKPYDLVFDSALFDESNTLPFSWYVKMWKLIPTGARKNMSNVYFVFASTYLRKITKNVSRIIKSKAVKKFRILAKPSELKQYLENGMDHLPKETVAFETDVTSTFSSVAQKNEQVVLKLSASSLQVVHPKDSIFNQTAHRYDIYQLAYVSDISVGAEKGDFVVKHALKALQFNSASVSEIVQAVKTSLARLKQENRLADMGQIQARTFTPSDMAGSLINMALLNLGSDTPSSRLAAYNLLAQLCRSFRFNLESMVAEAPGLMIPRNSANLVVSLSSELASSQPHLTLQFLNEWFHSMRKLSPRLKFVSLSYLPPWIDNLCKLTDNVDKVREVINLCIEATVEHKESFSAFLLQAWNPISRSEKLCEVSLVCLIEHAKRGDVPGNGFDTVTDLVVALAARNGTLVAKSIVDQMHAVVRDQVSKGVNFGEQAEAIKLVTLYARLLLAISFEHSNVVEEFCGDILHAVLLFFPSQPLYLRSTMYSLAVNTVYTISRLTGNPEYLQRVLVELSNPKHCLLFLGSSLPPTFGQKKGDASVAKVVDALPVTNVDRVAIVFQDVLNFCRASKPELVAKWEARWTELTDHTAFNSAPDLQARALVTLGSVSPQPSDKLLGTVSKTMQQALISKDMTSAIAPILCLTRFLPKMDAGSHFFNDLVWVGIALLQLGDVALFVPSLEFFHMVIKTHDARGFKKQTMQESLLAMREGKLSKICGELEKLSGVNFAKNFSFSLATILLKGLTHPPTKPATLSLLATLFAVSSKSGSEADAIGFIGAQLPFFSTDSTADLFTEQNFDHASAALLLALLSAFLRNIESEQEKVTTFRNLTAALHSLPSIFGPVLTLSQTIDFSGLANNEVLGNAMVALVQTYFTDQFPITPEARKAVDEAAMDFLGLQKSNTFAQITPSRNAAVARLISTLIESL